MAFLCQPFDIGNPGGVDRAACQWRFRVESAVRAAHVDQPCNEIDKRGVGVGPIDPGKFIVLRIGIVVASLRTAQFIAHIDHRRAARRE